jgi:putative DNA primase/helicase
VNPSANRDAALTLINCGLRIFPCNPDKTPRVTAWEQAATSSPFAVGTQWAAHSEALPGLPVGAYGLVVIDADRKNGIDGVAAFTALCAAHNIDLQSTLAVETPSGGYHFYFKAQAHFGNSRGSLPQGIDVRGVGGYVIAPGATLPDGRSYRIVQGGWNTIRELPEPLAALLREKQPAESSAPSQRPDATRVSAREREYAARALDEECAKVKATAKGERNDTLNKAAHSIGTLHGWNDANEACNALLTAALGCGLDEAEARKTIQSGYEAGKAKPRPTLNDWTDEELAELEPMIRGGIEACQRKHAAPSKGSAKRSVTLLQGAEIAERSIHWLWNGYLPQGKLTLLAGAGGTGKSTIAFNLAATITNGEFWPDGSRCNVAGNVLIWSSEDDPADTIKPRLMAVGANERRYGIISGTIDEQGMSCPFDAARDMDGLREAVVRIGGVSLLIIDPIVTAVTGDMHKANDVRRSLQTIVDFAAEMNCAVLGITHFAKGTAGKNSADRVIGSQAFAALARMVLAAAKEEESDRRVFTRAKSNNSIDTGGFSYSIEAVSVRSGIIATRVVWGEALEGSARSILAEVEGEAGEGASQLGIAKQFLLRGLANGPASSKELLEHAREGHGISANTLRRAQKELGIVATKAAFAGGWTWALPLANLSR